MTNQNTSLLNNLTVTYKLDFSSLGTGIDGITGIVKSNPFSSINGTLRIFTYQKGVKASSDRRFR